MDKNKRVMVVYWSRRGGLSRTMLELAELMIRRPELNVGLSVSDRNELATDFAKLSPSVKLFETFDSGLGALTRLPQFIARARKKVAEWRSENVGCVVVLMPHVWTPILGYFVRKAGIQYAVVVHDADPHIGDASAKLNSWIYRDISRADVVFTLSQTVADRIAAQGRVPAERIITLFHPLIAYSDRQPAKLHSPLRVLFLGRIMAYKGLPLLIEAIEKLRAEGSPVVVGVAGEGNLDGLRPRLAALNAEIINGWIEHARIAELQSRYDVVVLPYIEASQSGVVMSAFGAGVPVIVTPVGGLAEQVEDGVTGLVAHTPSASAIADSIRRLANEPALYAKLVVNIEARQRNFSVEAFAERMLAALRH